MITKFDEFIINENNDSNIKIEIKATSKYERTILRYRNDIITDTCLIGIEEDESFDKKYYTVVTYYDTNEPYAQRKKEKDSEFDNFLDARKEMSKRANSWKSIFEKI